MVKEFEGKTYLSSDEVKAHPDFGWSRDSLYRLYRAGIIKPKHFFRDKKSYWDLAELITVKDKPFEVGELSPKEGRQPGLNQLAVS